LPLSESTGYITEDWGGRRKGKGKGKRGKDDGQGTPSEKKQTKRGKLSRDLDVNPKIGGGNPPQMDPLEIGFFPLFFKKSILGFSPYFWKHPFVEHRIQYICMHM